MYQSDPHTLQSNSCRFLQAVWAIKVQMAKLSGDCALVWGREGGYEFIILAPHLLKPELEIALTCPNDRLVKFALNSCVIFPSLMSFIPCSLW